MYVDTGITIDAHVDVAADRLDEMLYRISRLLREYEECPRAGQRTEARMMLQVFPSSGGSATLADAPQLGDCIRVWRAGSRSPREGIDG